MPYKFEYTKMKLPKSLDRRVKYTYHDKKMVKVMYENGMSQRAIARKTGMSRRYLSFILFPERLEVCKKQFAERQKDGRYYDRIEHNEAVKSLRRHKQKNIDHLIK